jgi:multiple sugar transport system ATP-binding protein
MVFQSYALYPHMSVRQNIATPLRMRRLPLAARLPAVGRLVPGLGGVRREIGAAVEAAADALQIRELLDRRPAQLSGGQRQRVALARALVRAPAAFLMDEPLSNLDAKLRAHMREELASLHRRLGATFVYVTHDQIEAMTMSDRVALMEGGRILQLGTPTELYEHPASLSVARFIGTPAINLLPVEIDGAGRISGLGRDLGLEAAHGARGPATLGLRPEDLRIAGEGFAARILRTEHHGADRYVTLERVERDTPPLILRQRADEAPVPGADAMVTIRFETGKAHLFGADGARLALRERRQVAA